MTFDTLQFFSRSADKLPGFGAGEFVENQVEYYELSQIPEWRKMFSDMWIEDIIVDGLTYGTHHHAFQAAKFISAGLATTGYRFCKESKSDLANGTARDAFRSRKMVILTPDQMGQCKRIIKR